MTEGGLLPKLNPDWHAQVWARVPEGRILYLTSADCGRSGLELNHEVVRLLPRSSRRRAPQDQDSRADEVMIGDVHQLPFADSTFDHVVAAFFLQTTASDPIGAFTEFRRVIKVGGRLFLLEYGVSDVQPTRWLMQMINRVTQRFGARATYREAWELAFKGGFQIDDIEYLWGDVVSLIMARRPY